jgi:hypothetical protein
MDAIILAIFIGAMNSAGQLVGIAFAMLFVLPLTLLVVCMFTGLPAGAVIWLAERLRI